MVAQALSSGARAGTIQQHGIARHLIVEGAHFVEQGLSSGPAGWPPSLTVVARTGNMNRMVNLLVEEPTRRVASRAR